MPLRDLRKQEYMFMWVQWIGCNSCQKDVIEDHMSELQTS